MKENIGKTDKIIRLVAGLAILAAGVYFNSWLGILAIVPLGTAAAGTCPLYLLLGISTTGKKKKK